MVKQSVTIRDVAKRAKVSAMTVSRILSGSQGVSEKTKERVTSVMQKMCYVPSANARSLRSGSKLRASGALCFALIFGEDTCYSDGFFSSVSRACENKAAEFGLCPLQIHIRDDFSKSWPKLQAALSIPNLCGALLIGEFKKDNIDIMLKSTPNLVIVDGPVPAGSDVVSASIDYSKGCNEALEFLAKKECKNLLLLTGPKDHYFSKSMTESSKNFLYAFESIDIQEIEYEALSAKKAIEHKAANGFAYDGVFCNDEVAIGVLSALNELNIQVPEQVKVIGFDDIPHSSFTSPPLTTVVVDKGSLGSAAVEMLVDMINDNKPLSRIAGVKIIERKST